MSTDTTVHFDVGLSSSLLSFFHPTPEYHYYTADNSNVIISSRCKHYPHLTVKSGGEFSFSFPFYSTKSLMRTNLFFMNIFIPPLQTTNILWLTLCHCIGNSSQSDFLQSSASTDQKWNKSALLCVSNHSLDTVISQPIVANKHLAQCFHFFLTIMDDSSRYGQLCLRCYVSQKFIYYSHIIFMWLSFGAARTHCQSQFTVNSSDAHMSVFYGTILPPPSLSVEYSLRAC